MATSFSQTLVFTCKSTRRYNPKRIIGWCNLLTKNKTVTNFRSDNSSVFQRNIMIFLTIVGANKWGELPQDITYDATVNFLWCRIDRLHSIRLYQPMSLYCASQLLFESKVKYYALWNRAFWGARTQRFISLNFETNRRQNDRQIVRWPALHCKLDWSRHALIVIAITWKRFNYYVRVYEASTEKKFEIPFLCKHE
jgi:hypothetical protein